MMAPSKGNATSPVKKIMGFLLDSPRLVAKCVVLCRGTYSGHERLMIVQRLILLDDLKEWGYGWDSVSSLYHMLLWCSSAQIQVVDDSSSTSSPDIPETGLAKTLRHKGEYGAFL